MSELNGTELCLQFGSAYHNWLASYKPSRFLIVPQRQGYDILRAEVEVQINSIVTQWRLKNFFHSRSLFSSAHRAADLDLFYREWRLTVG